MLSRIRHLKNRFSGSTNGIDLVMLIATALLVVGAWCFVKIADWVFLGNTKNFDMRILRAMRDPNDLSDPIGPKWVEEAVRDISSLGSFAVISLGTSVVIGYLMIIRKFYTTGFILIAIIGGFLLNFALKNIFERPRPDIVPALDFVISTSFPSGHAQVSAVVYLTLGTILARLVSAPKFKEYLLGVAIFFTLIIGASRVYLGVHYPTDVLAGWIVGSVWSIFCWMVARKLQGRHMIEDIDTNEGNPSQSRTAT